MESCPYGAIRFVEEDQIKEEENIHKIGENIVVKVFSWLELYGIKK